MKKNLLMLFIAVIMAGGLGFAVPKVLSDTEPGIKVNKEKLKIVVKQQYYEDLQKSYEEKYMSPKEKKDGMTESNTKKKATLSEEDIKAAKMAELAKTAEQAKTAKTTKTVNKTKDSGTKVKDKSINKKIEANRSKIATRDLYAGSDVFNKLDTDYLFGLSDNGLTAKESIEADNYMNSKLSGKEYTDARDLYAKYVSLL